MSGLPEFLKKYFWDTEFEKIILEDRRVYVLRRILEYGEHAREPVNEYNAHCKSKAKYGFTLVFKLYCEKCGHSDFVKLSNTGWQSGKHSQILKRT